jgi:hypothetical protein
MFSDLAHFGACSKPGPGFTTSYVHGTDPPIKSLNRDSQQFHQKYISPQIIEQKKTTTYEVVNPGPGLEQAPKCAKSENIASHQYYVFAFIAQSAY